MCKAKHKIYMKLEKKKLQQIANNIYSNINKEAKAIANNEEIVQRVNCSSMADAFITLKDLS